MPAHRTGTRARRRGPAAVAVPGFRWPTYLVTAPHQVPQPPGATHSNLPYGVWHARRIGSPQAECGRSAITWRYFWTLEFDRAGPRACPECSRVLGAEAPSSTP